MVSLASIVVLVTGTFTAPLWNASQTAHDERLLGINGSPGPAILEIFRRNMLSAADAEQVRKLVDRLGAEDYRTREKSHAELLFWPAGAEGVLLRYENDDDPERRRRVRQILDRGLGRWSNLQAEAAVRLLRGSPSSDAVRVLVEYYPLAHDAGVRTEIVAALRGFALLKHEYAEAIREAAAMRAECRDLAKSLDKDAPKELSPTLRALDLTREFFAMVAQSESKRLSELTQLPFALGNGVILTSPDQRDDFFKQAIANYRESNKNATLSFLHVVRGEEFLRYADEQESAHLSGIPAHEIRIVHVRIRRDWQTEESGLLLVRVTEQRTVIVGLGQSGIRQSRDK